MFTTITTFLASGLFVFLLGIQTIFVVQRKLLSAALTSALIGTAQLAALKPVVANSSTIWAELAFVFGGSCGIVLSIWFHSHLIPLVHSWQKRETSMKRWFINFWVCCEQWANTPIGGYRCSQCNKTLSKEWYELRGGFCSEICKTRCIQIGPPDAM